MEHSCPMCGKTAATRDANRAFPFCSDRCRLLDLGNWLGESYRVPARADDDAASLPSDAGGEGGPDDDAGPLRH